MHDYFAYAKKRSFLPGQDIAKVCSLTTLRFKQEYGELNDLYYGYHITDSLAFWKQRPQVLHLEFYV